MGEKTYLCHVYGGFSPKGEIRNKESRLKKSIAILREPSISSAGDRKLVEEKRVRALTGGKEKSGREVCGGRGPEAERVRKVGGTGRYIRDSRSRRQTAGDYFSLNHHVPRVSYCSFPPPTS